MKENKTTPTGYKPSTLGPIPNDWENTELKFVASKIMVGIATEVRPHVRNTGIPILRNQNIRENYLDDSDVIYISEEFDRTNRNKRVKIGDILIVRTGSNVGQACIVTPKFNDAQTFTTLIVRPGERLNSDFLSLHINSFGIQEVERLSAGGGKPNLNAGFLHSYRIALPGIEEQRRIAKLIFSWDKAINTLTQLIAKKELRKKWLMQQLLTGKKRLKGFKGVWREYHLGDFFDERNETNYLNLPLLSIGQTGVYPQRESTKKDNSNEDKSKYRRICPGDIGYNTMRMWQGRSALSKLEGIVSPAYTILKPKKNTDPLFFSFLFKTPKLINSFFRNSQGLVEDTLNCKYKDFAIVKAHLPEKDEQAAIAKIILETGKDLNLLNKKAELIRAQKQGLMRILLTGKKRLKYK